MKEISITIPNPFNHHVDMCKVDVSELIEKAEFEMLKKHIKEHLKQALHSCSDDFKKGQLEYLIVQLYQPTDHIALISKLLKYSEFLYGIIEYDDVLNFLKCTPETIGDIKQNKSFKP